MGDKGHKTYTMYGYRQSLSWATFDSFQGQGWKIAEQYGVSTEELALSKLFLGLTTSQRVLTCFISRNPCEFLEHQTSPPIGLQ